MENSCVDEPLAKAACQNTHRKKLAQIFFDFLYEFSNSIFVKSSRRHETTAFVSSPETHLSLRLSNNMPSAYELT